MNEELSKSSEFHPIDNEPIHMLEDCKPTGSSQPAEITGNIANIWSEVQGELITCS